MIRQRSDIEYSYIIIIIQITKKLSLIMTRIEGATDNVFYNICLILIRNKNMIQIN